MTQTALIIDDEADIRELIAMSLDRIGLDTHTASNLAEARNLLDTYVFDVCLTDMKLPDGNGVEFVKYAQSIQPNLPVAVITAHGNMNAAVESMKNGAFDFVSKPVDINLLRKLVTQAINSHSNKIIDSSQKSKPSEPPVVSTYLPANDNTTSSTSDDQTRNTLSSLYGRQSANQTTHELTGNERMIGRSEPMQRLKKMISKVARTNAPVWITGESGTGKELIARLIHENGPRSGGPFIAINCGAIPSELMESEMFGHRKGSFTGAHSDHNGLFKRAEGGTLFLDEVAELPLHMQVKLLRAIQERTVRPVGSSEEINTDVRILSASHKDLAIEVDEGKFRHDLYYRLNVICIQSPSLRQRRDDIVPIARYVLCEIARKEGIGKIVTLTPEAEETLCKYTFPGNVRELENILERAVALSDEASITSTDLNLNNNDNQLGDRAIHLDVNATSTGDCSERQNILDALAKARWNRKAAAVMLGMTYRQLRYRIQQYGIDTDLDGTGT